MTELINERRMQSRPKQQAFCLDCPTPYDAAGYVICASSELQTHEIMGGQ
jgi:hypothetical protein